MNAPGFLSALAAWLLLGLPSCCIAQAQDAQTVLHLLDYIGVDYAEAVEDGKVKNAEEYKEMQEFTAQVAARIPKLADNPGRAALEAQAKALSAMVEKMDSPQAVGDAARSLGRALVAAYRLQTAPRKPPDLALGAKLHAQHCASCHGKEGKGDGPAAKGLEPAPSSFHELARMDQRSAYGLYNTITLGVEGTGMAAFGALSEDERWALAFYAATIGIPAARVADGERRWKAGEARAAFPDLVNVATLSSNEVVARHGETAARVQDYLRAHPAVLKPAPLAFSRQKLAEALEAHRSGNAVAARNAAITAYLEGFELAEAALANVDPGLMRGIEREMMELRAALERSEPPAEFARRVERVDALLAAAQEKLGSGELSPASAFVASLLILLREGLEAILVLAAIIAFVLKTGRRDAMPWIHAGWLAALAMGALTWIAAAFFIDISGADRELTEGVTALLASAMLLYVGWWLHGRSQAAAWTSFIRDTVGKALEKRTLWAMAGVSFLAVYREMFEVVLFYQTLWAQAGDGGRHAVLGGAGLAALLLGVLGLAIFKLSIRLPIGPLFSATSALLVLLAVVFAGHGVAALQEAGVVGMTTLGFEPVRLLGIYPSAEALAAQGIVLVAVALGFASNRLRSRPTS